MKNENRGMSKRTVAILLALVLLIGCAVGGTLAWLTDKTQEVTNTFTTSDISIELTESKDLNLKMIPGWTIAKDPKVTVEAGSEACWLFVKIEKSDSYSTYLENYSVRSGWKQGSGKGTDEGGDGVPTNVYYRSITSQTTTDTSFYVLAGEGTGANANGYVTVKDSVTKEQMNDLNKTGATQPTLTFTAYACQYYSTNNTPFTAVAAWEKANSTASSTASSTT